MITDVGEYLVGAYLQLVEGCDFIQYNVRPPASGLSGLPEFDVIGFKFKVPKKAYLCEVTTHITNLLYKNNLNTIKKLTEKHARQKKYATDYLVEFEPVYQFWSPCVPIGYLTTELKKSRDLELVINGEYKRRIEKLQELAKTQTRNTGNPVFRIFQIIGHMRDIDA